MKRYVISPEDTWHARDSVWGTNSSIARIEVRDVIERHPEDGRFIRLWHNGAHRVVSPFARTKVFIGETSWCQAERHASDIENKRRFAR